MSDPDHEYVDIGHDHAIQFASWSPDRQLNPQYADVPDIPRITVMVKHNKPDGTPCIGSAAYLDLPGVRELVGEKAVWQVVSMEPLHLEPSLLCMSCSDHGFIRGGAWIPA